ncbi:hypothetical protein [Ochrobactrum sp. Marseille-Q0166]|uniref:hypothetical protein n=1 Tax=Ochrobactrum sp. Marseille-Q0166 TaxID=2761105 RepID=UPI001655769C|nr:hypothetical protein [Ochrobactrum sp. Marseille-Q0166]MBC8719937.1 hypothetical protein [Ochrobactrum sp. Marseille-Q0166]
MTGDSNRLRIVIGFLLAPLASGLLQLLILGAAGFPVVIFSYPVALILGIPVYIAARKLGWLSLKATLLGGAALGGLTGLVIITVGGGMHSSAVSFLFGFALLAAHGGIVAAAFWFIALWRNGLSCEQEADFRNQ